MSLIQCPECGERVSNKAAFCPHCGFPEPREIDLKRYEIAFDGFVEKKYEYQVTSAIFRATGIDIDTAQKLANTENALIATDMDFESADSACAVLRAAGAPAVMREVGGAEVTSDIVRCPDCGSPNFEVYESEDDFNIGRGVLGTVIAGPVGALVGFTGEKKRHRYRLCSNCGCKF